LALDGGWVIKAVPRPLSLGNRPATHCAGRWVGPRPGLDGCREYRPTGFRFLDGPVRSESNFCWLHKPIV